MYNANQGCGTGVGQPADLPRKPPWLRGVEAFSNPAAPTKKSETSSLANLRVGFLLCGCTIVMHA